MDEVINLIGYLEEKVNQNKEMIVELKMEVANLKMKIDVYETKQNNEGVFLNSTPTYVKDYIKKKRAEKERE